jgi:peptidoglycan/LPS O-acetylase OafA/YrhL
MGERQGHNERLEGVQFGRGIAACLVVLYHAGRMLALPQYVGHEWAAKSLFAFGNIGVDFFFVLSGFIILYVHERDVGRPERLGHYLWRRVTRIYPVYWVVTAFIIALAILKKDWALLTLQHVLSSIFLFPSDRNPILDVGWTLTHEVLFYLIFAGAILSRRLGMLLGLAWLASVIAGLVGFTASGFLRFVADPYHLEFGFGMLAALATRRRQGPHAWLAAMAGIALFAGVAALIDLRRLDSAEAVCRIALGFASALILYGVSVCEQLGQIRIPRWASYLGAASYSIYLVHTIFVGFAARAIFKLPAMHELPNAAFTIAAGAGIAAGCLVYQFIERPLQKAVRHRPVWLGGLPAPAPGG